MRLIDIKCTECNEVERDFPVGDTELSFDFVHTCLLCGGTALRIPNAVKLRGTRKGKETRTYLDGTKRAGFSELLLENQLREAAMDTFDDKEAARLHMEADRVAATKSSGQE